MRRPALASLCLLAALPLGIALPPGAASASGGGETKAFVLDNGMEVLLTSDPSLDRSAAALSVNVGAMNDGDRAGTAHFLEHMLFLGTTKYPDDAAYKKYLAENDGMSNAYTSSDHTCYFFELRSEAFEGALDRFSRFFVDPLMTDTLSAREVNAVDSEHSKNLQNEFWRTRQVYRSLLNPAHPHAGFSTGNSTTLAGVKNEALRGFYEANYSSNLMHLAIVSPFPLEQLESWVREKFSDVPNRGHSALDPSVPLYHDGLRGQMIEVRSLQDVHDLWLRFEMPEAAFDPASKPTQILGGILGHEGRESLLQSLKDDGLATSLSAGAQRVGDQGTFNFTLTLTPEGMARVDDVLERIFGMVNHLRSLPEIPTHVIEQRQKMAELELRFRARQRPANEARSFAASMISYPHDDLLPSLYLIPAPTQESLRLVLDQMTPENAVVVLASKDRETDQVEKYYQAAYRIQPLGEERIARLKTAAPDEGMGVPAPNPFIPSDFTLVDPVHAETPWVHRFEQGEAWLRHDTLFGQPKAAAEVVLFNDKNSRSVRDFVLGNLYASAVQMAMNPYSYPLLEAGVNLGVSNERRGITLTASGYSQKIPELAEFAVPFLREPRIEEAQFAVIKEGYARSLANFPLSAPSGQAFELFRELIREVHYTPAQQAAALAPLTFADLQAYFARVHEAVRIRAFFYGNMTEDGVRQTVDKLVAGLAPNSIISEEDRYNGRVLKFGAGNHSVVRRPIESNDSVTLLLIQGEPADREERAALTVLGKILPPKFFNDLRTLQQTGYIVQSGAFEIEGLPTLFLMSQSSVVDTDSLRGRFVSHLAHFLEDLDELSDEDYTKNRDAAIAQLAKKSTTFDEELQRNTRLAFEHHGDLADTEKQIAALGALTRERWIELTRTYLGAEARQVAIQLDGGAERRRFQERELGDIREGGEGFVDRPKPQ